MKKGLMDDLAELAFSKDECKFMKDEHFDNSWLSCDMQLVFRISYVNS